MPPSVGAVCFAAIVFRPAECDELEECEDRDDDRDCFDTTGFFPDLELPLLEPLDELPEEPARLVEVFCLPTLEICIAVA